MASSAQRPDTRTWVKGNAGLRQRRYSARPFLLTLALFTLLGAIAFWSQSTGSSSHVTFAKRDFNTLLSEDEECRLVHQAADQCAYIREHCPDDEPGFLAYLELYYCYLDNAKPVAFIILVFWLALLFSTIGIAASDFFCIDLSTIATMLGMSESMAGVTFLAFGNGSPDVFSTFAAMTTNSSSLAIGELMGAAGFITAVVAGSMAFVRPFKVAKKSFIRDVGFFVVAASFSMGFLADGRLHLWECLTMVGFYIFYVGVVCIWHWWLSRHSKRREKEARARGHFFIPGNEELAIEDDGSDGDDADSRSRPTTSRGASSENFSLLERGSIPTIEEPDDFEDDEEARDRWLAELGSNMRLNRAGRSRRNTLTPIRPSLVGALEFQAVLSSLNRARNMQRIPMHLRRYSDNPTDFSPHTVDDDGVTVSTGIAEQTLPDEGPAETDTEIRRPSLEPLRTASGNRTRAVSTNDASTLQVDSQFLQKNAPKMPRLIDIPEDDPTTLKVPAVDSGTVSPRDNGSTRSLSPVGVGRPRAGVATTTHLAPPTEGMPDGFRSHGSNQQSQSHDSPAQSPKARPLSLGRLRIPSASRSSRGSSPTSPFPEFRDDFVFPRSRAGSRSRAPSLMLPSASVSIDLYPFPPIDDQSDEKPLKWWPYQFLPGPRILLGTLFPTLYNFREKSWWERILAIVAAPSVFLLTITLPVVECEAEDEDDMDDDFLSQPGSSAPNVSSSTKGNPNGSETIAPVEGAGGTASVATRVEHRSNNKPSTDETEALLDSKSAPTPKVWSRWLTITQLFLSPIMVVLIIYTQYIPPEGDFGKAILRPILIALLVSTVMLIPFLLTTSPTHRPQAYLTILSLAGFAVSIAWISTIAGQVVTVLKTFAIILNMSHAILGLTVFAVGNSLGDLVADITVARLGYPVMALSACFGGPMLNILLGIGLSGSWILIRGAEHRHEKHPDRPIKFKTYEIEISETLVVSGVGLLVTLVGLLIAVPLNKWMMDRKIAFVLIALWVLVTITNVVLECVGLGEKID